MVTTQNNHIDELSQVRTGTVQKKPSYLNEEAFDFNLTHGIGERISELLIDHDMTQKELARLLHVPSEYITHWIKGRRHLPDEYKIQMSDIFDVPVQELTTFNCQIEIKGEVQDDWTIIDYDNNSPKKYLKMKNVILPSDTVGYQFAVSSKFWWRHNTIWAVRIRKNGAIPNRWLNPDSHNRLSFLKVKNGNKYIAVPSKYNPDATDENKYNVISMGSGDLLETGVELEYTVPLLLGIPNWAILEKTFYPDL